jgi:hypothetical protein
MCRPLALYRMPPAQSEQLDAEASHQEGEQEMAEAKQIPTVYSLQILTTETSRRYSRSSIHD